MAASRFSKLSLDLPLPLSKLSISGLRCIKVGIINIIYKQPQVLRKERLLEDCEGVN